MIVLDHFHVKKYLNETVDAVGKEELRKARQQNQGDLSQIHHCNKRFILMQNHVFHKQFSQALPYFTWLWCVTVRILTLIFATIPLIFLNE
ncbi:MAG: transposase [Planctomycetia bacterium]|nr:transposase [Candidatus Brocadia sp.]QOJ07125.1 MAG: transposase [Planctomycetia bacterium]HQU31407.1 transposase [Candidatus Brocadia sapporoensis]